jgi:hypothetical protein
MTQPAMEMVRESARLVQWDTSLHTFVIRLVGSNPTHPMTVFIDLAGVVPEWLRGISNFTDPRRCRSLSSFLLFIILFNQLIARTLLCE